MNGCKDDFYHIDVTAVSECNTRKNFLFFYGG